MRNVTVTPHVAAFPRPAYVAQTLVGKLRRARACEPLENVAGLAP